MGCCGDREKGDELVKTEQRWDYINLDDFKTKSCWTPLAYGWLWLMLIVSVSVYAVDTFTAVNLIAFDRWSGQIQPAIPLSIARWIFAGCIVASFLLLGYRWWRAVRVMKQGSVAKSYLDPLAVRIQSIRMGREGRGYKRFLIFAELTKSRKGADYVALFSYFSFEAWLRIVLAEGPRQVVNGITLYSVMQAKLIPEGENAGDGRNSSFVQFWLNVGELADKDRLQAAILLGMLWTLLIWVLAALSLAVSVILYLIFLWHHIPSQDGTLSKYCRNKINRRMERIVKVKVDKALKKENEIRGKLEARAEREGLKLKMQPTLPDITAVGSTHSLPPLSRQDTMATLPEYESRPGSIRGSEDSVPPMPGPYNNSQRPGPTRHATQRSDVSWSSYNSNAPLMSSAGEMGIQTPASVNPGPWVGRSVPSRMAANFSDRTTTPGPRPPTAQSGNSFQMEPLPRSNTNASNGSNVSRTGPDFAPPPARGQTPGSGHPVSASVNGSYFPLVPDDQNRGRAQPGQGPPGRSFTLQEQPTRSFTPTGPPPQRSFTPGAPPPPRSFTPHEPPPRSFTPGGPPPPSLTPQGMPPPKRPITPYDEPTLPRLDTNMPVRPSYPSETQRSATPASAHPSNYNPHHNAYQPYQQHQAQPQPQQEYRSFSRAQGPGMRNDSTARDSGVDDILNHY